MSTRDKNDTWSKRKRPTPKAEVSLADRMTVEASPSDVLTRLRDAEFVAGCLPGLVPGSLKLREDGIYLAQMRCKAVGVTATWDLEVSHDASPDVSGIAITMAGKDPKLNLTMNGSANVDVSPVEKTKAELDYKGYIVVEGRLAATGGPLIRRIVDEILERFIVAIAAQGEAEPEGPRTNGLAGLVAKIRKLVARLKERFGNNQQTGSVNRSED